MPLLTDRDREEIRTGRNRTIGAIYARPLFWGPIIVKVLLAVAFAGLLLVLAVKVHDVWVGGLGRAVADDWLIVAAGGVLVAVFVGLVILPDRQPRRRSRRRRRR